MDSTVGAVFQAWADGSDSGVYYGAVTEDRPSEPYTLAGAVAEICERVGMPPVRTT